MVKDVTVLSLKEKNDRAKKMMLWFGLASLLMVFAGLTSAYIVSSSRDDWSAELELPTMFYISAIVIMVSSITYIMAKKSIEVNKPKASLYWLMLTLGLGVLFIIMQFNGFAQLVSQGDYFTGPTSTIKSSYIYVMAGAHIVHVVAGIISLLIVLYKHIKGKYTASEYLGLSLGATFWHFLDLLWLYLVVFMTFVK
ncbi:cytochrome c oxidase subunit 3 [Aurantibacter sp.]|uniref:cytochrome c oxidase subunit 3 n=1 Tax=Aurantibacter sp. TaxID=2807103 RepID=UPI003264A8AF